MVCIKLVRLPYLYIWCTVTLTSNSRRNLWNCKIVLDVSPIMWHFVRDFTIWKLYSYPGHKLRLQLFTEFLGSFQIRWATQSLYVSIYRVSQENGPNFGRVFLMLNYTDITQNTYIPSWTVTEIMAREKCGHLASCISADVWRIDRERGMRYVFLWRHKLRPTR